MPESPLKFPAFQDAAAYFFGKFSAAAPPRFEKYLSAAAGKEIEAVARYRWNLQLCESLLPCFHTAELTLRNAIHQAMVEKYLPASKPHFPDGSHPDGWWFDHEIRGVRLLDDRDYDKVQEAYHKVSKGGGDVTSKVVAELSFGFWVELLNSKYDETIVVPMLGTTMKGVQKTKAENRTHGWLRARFGEIRDLRNRVSHHEPIYHRADVQSIWSMAWNISYEIDPWFTRQIIPICRFESVWKAKWVDQERAIRVEVRDLFARNREEPQESC